MGFVIRLLTLICISGQNLRYKARPLICLFTFLIRLFSPIASASGYFLNSQNLYRQYSAAKAWDITDSHFTPTTLMGGWRIFRLAYCFLCVLSNLSFSDEMANPYLGKERDFDNVTQAQKEDTAITSLKDDLELECKQKQCFTGKNISEFSLSCDFGSCDFDSSTQASTNVLAWMNPMHKFDRWERATPWVPFQFSIGNHTSDHGNEPPTAPFNGAFLISRCERTQLPLQVLHFPTTTAAYLVSPQFSPTKCTAFETSFWVHFTGRPQANVGISTRYYLTLSIWNPVPLHDFETPSDTLPTKFVWGHQPDDYKTVKKGVWTKMSAGFTEYKRFCLIFRAYHIDEGNNGSCRSVNQTISIGAIETSRVEADTCETSAGVNVIADIVAPVVGTTAFILLAVVIIIFQIKRRIIRARVATNPSPDEIPSNFTIAKPRISINRTRPLGVGQFGKIYLGELLTGNNDYFGSTTHPPNRKQVAVKTWKNERNARFHEEFDYEAKILIKIGWHPNIVTLFGVCKEGYMWLIMEYCSNGSLDKFLKRTKSKMSLTDNNSDQTELSGSVFGRFCDEICRGMCFISSMGIIHRDLAARNVLLDGSMTAKISDFGMAREESEYTLERNNVPLPIKWMAPESIKTKLFSPKSDVWSFGIVVWEIFSLGSTPFDNVCSASAIDGFYNFLKEGYRLPRPGKISDEMYQLMITCWELNPENRPNFAHISLELQDIVCPEFRQTYITVVTDTSDA